MHSRKILLSCVLITILIFINTNQNIIKIPKKHNILRAESEVSGDIINDFPYFVSHKTDDGIIKAYALCIGPTEYPGDKDLPYPDDDAFSWATYLSDHKYNVTCIVGYVDSETIILAIKNLLEAEDADDYVAFIYSGHGSYIYDPEFEKNVSAIWLSDGKFITQDFFAEVNSLLDSNHVFWFFDACTIGGMRILGTTGRYVAMASNETTYTYGSSQYEHGVFTYYFLIDALMKKNNDSSDDGNWAEDAFDYAYKKCTSETIPIYPEEADGNPDKAFYIWDNRIQGRDSSIGGGNPPPNPPETPIITPYYVSLNIRESEDISAPCTTTIQIITNEIFINNCLFVYIELIKPDEKY